ncbi:MAG: DUF1405 domain-containing protein [Clostridia bacterium]|nr:DUF1405 domain-containing protein [Clostridia bacterium]
MNIFNLLRNPFRKWFLTVLIIVNILGSIYGYYWYAGQLAVTPKKLWLFTFDSPFSTTLFALALLGISFGVKNRILQLVAYTSVIKYGLWAAVVIVHSWLTGIDPTWITVMLLLTHLGMAAEGFIFIRHLRVSYQHLAFLSIWFLLNDYMDYVVGVHPYLYHPGQFGTAAVSAVGLTFLLLIYVWRSRLIQRHFIFKK